MIQVKKRVFLCIIDQVYYLECLVVLCHKGKKKVSLLAEITARTGLSLAQNTAWLYHARSATKVNAFQFLLPDCIEHTARNSSIMTQYQMGVTHLELRLRSTSYLKYPSHTTCLELNPNPPCSLDIMICLVHRRCIARKGYSTPFFARLSAPHLSRFGKCTTHGTVSPQRISRILWNCN
ncbi:hypothetical protein P153DRAFT_198053 [Dothidotthia symphoricarpi CBS 119687]|uniref:Uncharacterized protein n=1 Tax=Dothidotthia symphoricarpi CBS 119687 TaxID=1392245 RepID=A0A6A6AKB1_9PLEO|nr:uncharacterized protein P153DRAFT_198053 [Dothidotthia symphoricarpi CBS 119687]KAF2131535.1 hypothetical protein P153DRAFT_198053 [Dothidotthia symphoricarpi CBS 119687]